MSTFNVSVDPSSALTYLQRLSSQVPFAVSKTLNDVANEVQKAQRLELNKTFTINAGRKTFVERLIKRTKEDMATKDNLSAVVRIQGSESSKKGSGDVLARHVNPTAHSMKGDPFFIPSKEIRPGAYDVAPRSLYPRALRLFAQRGVDGVLAALKTGKRRKIAGVDSALKDLRKAGLGGTFIAGKGRSWGVYQRVGSGSGGIKPLWFFRTSIRLTKRFAFGEVAQDTANKLWVKIMSREFANAEKTARR